MPAPKAAKSPADSCLRQAFVSFFGIIGPVMAVAFALVTRSIWMECGVSVPLPRNGHALLVLVAPLAIFKGLCVVDREGVPLGLASFLLGLALAPTLGFALMSLPWLPAAALCVLCFGLGILGFVPIVCCAILVRVAIRIRRQAGARGDEGAAPFAAGLVLGFLAVLLADFSRVKTSVLLDRVNRGNQVDAAAIEELRDPKYAADLEWLVRRGGRIDGPVGALLDAILLEKLVDESQAYRAITGRPVPNEWISSRND